jgi:hypothetical protein
MHFRFLMDALQFGGASVLFGDGIGDKRLQSKGCGCQKENARWCGWARGTKQTTKQCQQDVRFLPNFGHYFNTTSPTTYQKMDLQLRLAVELYYFFHR